MTAMASATWSSAFDIVDAAKAAVATAPPPNKLSVFKQKTVEAARLVAEGWIAQSEFADEWTDSARSNGLLDQHGADTIQQIIADALDDTVFPGADHEPPPPTSAADYGLPDEAPPIGGRAETPLQFMDLSGLDEVPVPERKWAILNRVPLHQAGLFSGEGGTGKSIIELQKNVAHVMGKDWLGSMPALGPAIYVGAEDDKDELHIRLAAIAKHHGVTFKDLADGGLHILPMLGQDATLCAPTGKSGKVETTALYRKLYQAAGDIKPKNISIDTLSRAFVGSEIDRVQVYGFAMHMQALAMAAEGSVTILSHPSLAGIASGSGISGTTGWHGAYRFRQYLKGVKPAEGEQPDSDIRELEFKKNQYGPCADSIVLRYQHGLFLPEAGVSSLDKLAREHAADDAFVAVLTRFNKQGRNLSPNPGKTYAPTLLAQDGAAKGFTARDFAGAMARLLNSDRIHVETEGPPSRRRSRLMAGAAPT